MAPLVSVVMPNYNGQRFLPTALDSILAQTYEHFELIVVDDGSTDDSRGIIARYAARDRRIRSVLVEHGGLIKALNHGCDLSRGEYIARFDSDDVAMRDRLEAQVAYMTTSPETALLGGAVECIDDRGAPCFIMMWPGRSEGLHDYLLLDCPISHTTVFMRREAFWQIGGYREAYACAEDYDLFLRMSDSHAVDNLPQVLCQYRLHANSVSIRKASQQIVSSIAARLATNARRSRRAEPVWPGPIVSRADLIALGVEPGRIDAAIAEYPKDIGLSGGWRWGKNKFCITAGAR